MATKVGPVNNKEHARIGKRYPSISWQILVAVLITVVLVLGVSSFVELNLLKKREILRLQQKGVVTADRIANSLSYPLWNLNPAGTKQVIHDEIASVDVFRIRVYDEKGALYAGAVREADGSVKQIDEQSGDAGYATPAAIYSFSRDIDFKNTHIGAVLLDLTDRQLQAQLNDLRWAIAVKLLVLALLLPLVIFLTLRGLVIRPLSSLRAWVHQIHSTEMKRAPRFKRAGEINALAEAFDSMSTRLQEKNRELKSNEALLREFIKHTPAAIAMLDTQMRYVQASDRFLTDYHLEGQSIIGQCHYDVFPNLPTRWKEAHQRILAGAVERFDEDPYPGPDGGTEWLQWEGLPWRKAGGEIGGLVLFTQVITERKRAEQELRASEERFSKIFNLSPYRMVIIRQRDNVVLQVNDTWMRETGFTREEVIGRSILQLDDWLGEEGKATARQLIEGHSAIRGIETTVRKKSGEECFVRADGELLTLDGEACVLWAAIDITARKRAEEAVRKSEEKFAKAFRSSPIGIAVTRLKDGVYLEVNETLAKVIGYDVSELIGKSTFELGLWDSLGDRSRLIEDLEKSGASHNQELVFRNRAGDEVVSELSAEIIELDGEKCVLSVISDITERKRAEQSLRASEEKFATIFNLSPNRMGIIRQKDGIVLQVNDTWVRETGFSREEMVGKPIFEKKDWLGPDTTSLVRQLIAEGRPIRGVEIRVQTKSGQELVVLGSAEILVLDGEPCFLWVASDITERKRAEESLRLSEERFSLAFHASPEPISIRRDRDGVLVELNDRWSAVYGYSREEAIGRTATEVGMITAEERERLKRALDEKPSLREFEVDLRTKQNDIRHISLSCEPIVVNDEPCNLYLHRDITETRRASEENRQLIHDLGERVKELTALHRTAWILQKEQASVSDVLAEMVALLPPAFQYPEVTAGRVRLGEVESVTPGFEPERPLLSASFQTSDDQLGSIDVVYTDERPPLAEGPFLKEERALINTLAEMLRADYDRRHSEAALRESEQRFRQLTDNIRDVLWLVNPDYSKVLYISPAYETVWGRTRASLVENPYSFLDGIHPEDRERVTETVEKESAHGFDHEYRVIRPDGTTAWIWDRGFPIIDESGQVSRIAGIAEDITYRKQAETELKTSEERLRALSAKVQSAREEEGRRIAREIHDELGSALTGLKWDLERIDKELSNSNGSADSAVHERITIMNSLIEETINTVRRISSELRPGMLDDLGVVAAIEWQAQQIHKRTGLNYHWDSLVETVNLSRERATAVFRIFQEITTNVLRHSAAENFFVKLRQTDEHFVLQVKDDGRGITDSEKGNTRSLGLLGMKERALLVGGEVDIVGAPNRGTTVTVRVPL
jgi:PAS domain S-box-containing protein